MALGGKSRLTEQAAPRTPEASAQSGADRDQTVRAQVRAHVRQILRQVRPQAAAQISAERN